jgi:hypothetical protein
MTTHTYVVGILAGGTQHNAPYDDHEWIIDPGYHAPIQGWILPADTVDAIMTTLSGGVGTAREVTLTLGDPDSPTTVERVLVIGTAASDNPQRKVLLLTDVRWYFTRAWMCLDVNVRRRVGDTRLVGDTLQTASVVDSIAYAPWSISHLVGGSAGAAYDWSTFKDQVLTYLTTARHGRPAISFVTDTFTVIDPTAKIVRETSLDAPGPSALAHAIESIPGASIYVDLTGTIHVYERTPGAEIPVVEALPPDLDGHGSLVLANNEALRPADSAHSWRVYVDYEIEVRFDYKVATMGLNDPLLIPCLQVTDPTLEIPAGTYFGNITRSGSASDRTVGQGSWISQAEAFAAWCYNGGSPAGPTYAGLTLPVLTDDIVAKNWFSEGLEFYAGFGVDALFSPLWSNRIDELRRCYRTFFRINPRFWDRIRHAWAIRAAVWDPVTGQRAPASVYQNFSKVPANIFAISSATDYFGVNVMTSYPVSGLLREGTPTAFRAHIVDKELGIIAIDRNHLSRYADAKKINLSPIALLPAIDNNVLDSAAQELISSTSGSSDDWKLAVVMSVSPAAPNDLRRMYEIQVSTAEAAATAGLTGYGAVGSGPDQELRSHLSQARIAWQDDSGVFDQILALLGCTDVVGTSGTDQITTKEAMSVGNPLTGFGTALTPVNLNQELKPLAKALAAADLLSKLDHYVGERAVPMDASIVPIGAVTRVIHKVLENRAVTVVHCTRHPAPFRAIDFLQGTARALLLHEIQNQQR